MKAVAAILLAIGVALLSSGTVIAGTMDAKMVKASLTTPDPSLMTEAANVLVLQEPARGGAQSDNFISVDTVVIGCTAGAAAGALAIALPVLTVASSGIGLPASASAIVSTAGIGCAVGVVSGLAAIGTAWGLNLLNSLSDSGS